MQANKLKMMKSVAVQNQPNRLDDIESHEERNVSQVADYNLKSNSFLLIDQSKNSIMQKRMKFGVNLNHIH